MALNIAREDADQVSVPVPEGTTSGDLVMIGDLPAVALIDRGEWTDGEATVKFNGSVYVDVDLAVDVGDVLYNHAGTVNKTGAGGDRVGVALSSVGAEGGRVEVKIAK